jgi:hypothetical protein
VSPVKPRTAATTALLLATASAVAFLIVGLHELDYAGGHPGRYGPARVIAWGAFAGVVLSAAVCLLAYAATWSGRA